MAKSITLTSSAPSDLNVDLPDIAPDFALLDTGTIKLKAEDYSTEDLNGVGESAAGSGQLNYLLLQAQQTYEGQKLSGITQTYAQNDAGVGGADAAGMPAHATAQHALSGASMPVQTEAGRSGDYNVAGSDNAGDKASGGSTLASLTASTGTYGNTIATGFQNFVNIDGDITNYSSSEERHESTTNTEENNYDTTINNYYYPPNPPTPTPLLELHLTGTVAEPLMAPVGAVLNTTTGLITQTAGGLNTLVTTPVNHIPTAALNLVGSVTNNALSGTQTIVSETTDATLTTVNNLGNSLVDTLNGLGNGDLTLASTLNNSGVGSLLNATASLTGRGLGPLGLDTTPLINQTVGWLDATLAPVQSQLGAVVAQSPVGTVLLGTASGLENVLAHANPLLQGAAGHLNNVVEQATDTLGGGGRIRIA